MRNIIKTVTIVVVLFLVCCTPIQLIFILAWAGVYELDYSSWIYLFTVQLQFSYCLINPIIYAVKYREFRSALSRLVHKVMPIIPRAGQSRAVHTITVQSATKVSTVM
jgi:ABC-type uncharacterized transport system permease subunit